MTKNRLTLLVVILASFAITNVCTSLEVQSAQKLKKITGPGSDTIVDLGKKPSVFVPLTEAECTGLGGKVLPTAEGSCHATSKVCYTTDPDGVIHSACITVN